MVRRTCPWPWLRGRDDCRYHHLNLCNQIKCSTPFIALSGVGGGDGTSMISQFARRISSNHCPFHYSRASSITLVLATSNRHAHPVRVSSAPTTPGCVLRYRHRPRARGEKTAGVLKMGRPPGFWAFWAETVAKTHRHAFAWPSGSGVGATIVDLDRMGGMKHKRHSYGTSVVVV